MRRAGTLVGDRYRLLDVLGEGGMAVVYRARDEVLERDVAVKILRPQFASDDDFVQRFRQEARSAASLSHPNVAAVFDTGVDAGRQYIVIQLVDGPNLEQVLAERGRLPVAEALRITLDVAEALHAAHERGIVHRDVKPGNILLTADGSVRVVDFGIARALREAKTTTPGLLLGSVQYCSPEQVLGEDVGPASDIYSLGIVLYELLTGSRPYDGPSPAAVALERVRRQPELPSRVVPDLPAGLDPLVMRALERDPADRYPTSRAFVDAIRGWWRASRREAVEQAAGLAAARAADGAPTRRTVIERRRAAAAAAPAGATVATLASGTLPVATRRARPDTARTTATPRPGSSRRGVPAATATVAAAAAGPGSAVGPASAAPSAATAAVPIAGDAMPRGAVPAAGAGPGNGAVRARADRSRDRRRIAGLLIPLATLLVVVLLVSAMFDGRSRGGVLSATASPAPSAAAVVAATPSPTASPTPSPSPTPEPTARPTPRPTPRATPRATAPPTPRPTPRPTSGSTLPARDPAETVARFYSLVVQHNYSAAAALWTSHMKSTCPPSSCIWGRFDNTTRIVLHRNRIVSLNRSAGTARVAVDLSEYRTNGTVRRWVGSWDLVLTSRGWLLNESHF